MNIRVTIPLLCFALALSACSSGDGDDPAAPTTPDWGEAQAGNTWWLNVFSTAADDRWVVGGTTSQGAVLHYDGSQWSNVPVGFSVPLLNWTYGFAKNDLVMVGNEGTILTYDGTDFTQEISPSQENLWGVWGATKDVVYAVGGSGRTDSKATLLQRNGGTWSELDYPTLQRPGVFAFFKVWGSSADDVYVVGQNGVVLHWDGSIWEEQFVFQPGQAAVDLIAVWGSSADKVAIVGGRNNGVLVLKDGANWRSVDLATNAYPGLNGVWMAGDKVHTVGNSGQVLRIDYVTGGIELDTLLPTQLDLHAVHGTLDGTLTTVSFNPIALTEADSEGEVFTRGTTDAD